MLRLSPHHGDVRRSVGNLLTPQRRPPNVRFKAKGGAGGLWARCHGVQPQTFKATILRPGVCTSAAKRTGLSRSEIVREAVRRQLSLVLFQDLRRRIMPLAEARGYLTDEDVFRDIS